MTKNSFEIGLLTIDLRHVLAADQFLLNKAWSGEVEFLRGDGSVFVYEMGQVIPQPGGFEVNSAQPCFISFMVGPAH